MTIAHHTYPKSSLQPRLKHISQATIQSKWKVLDAPTQAKVESLFQSVGLPVLARHTKQTGKVEAQDAIALVTRSLCKRLPKMPFPQTTREGHFDYDELVKSNVSRCLQSKYGSTPGLVLNLYRGNSNSNFSLWQIPLLRRRQSSRSRGLK